MRRARKPIAVKPAARRGAPPREAVKTVNLALQGGGSHGAYTWGALDAFAEDGRIEISAISGASAGAMNAVVFASGISKGGREGRSRGVGEILALGVVGRLFHSPSASMDRQGACGLGRFLAGGALDRRLDRDDVRLAEPL